MPSGTRVLIFSLTILFCKRLIKLNYFDHVELSAWQSVIWICSTVGPRAQALSAEVGRAVTILTNADTHPQTLMTATVAAQSLGASSIAWIFRSWNGDKSLSPDHLPTWRDRPEGQSGGHGGAPWASDLVLDLMLLFVSPETAGILSAAHAFCWR